MVCVNKEFANVNFYGVTNRAKNGNTKAWDEMINRVLMAQAGDEDFTMDIINGTEGIVKKFAIQFSKSCNISTFDDLVSCANLGILKAIKSYDKTKKVLFSTWAYHQIHGVISELKSEYTTCNNRPLSIEKPTDGEMAKNTVTEDMIVDDRINIFDSVQTSVNKQILLDAIKQLSQAQRVVIVGHYLKGFKQEELAEMLNISHTAVNTRMVNGRKTLKKLLNGKIELY